MKVVFSRLAVRELQDAIAFYEIEKPGLGGRFKTELKKAVRRIVDFPNAWSVERGDVRKCLLHRFPYKVLYSIESDRVFVIAVAHQHRRPDYWVDEER